MVLHGNGEQAWMTKSFEHRRVDAILNPSAYSDEELDRLGLSNSEKSGKYDESLTLIEVQTYPIDKMHEIKVYQLRDNPMVK